MPTIGIAKRVFGIANVQKTQRANERQSVARVDGGSKDPDGEQEDGKQFYPSIFFLAMALQSFELLGL